MNRIVLKSIILFSLITIRIGAKAQCEVENLNFQPGEFLTYDLYFKYGILYTKAGTSTMSVSDARYEGKEVYRTMLTAKSSGAAKAVFSLSDTLMSYTTQKLVPLAYLKNAHEGGKYLTERATYDYSSGEIKLRNINKRNEHLRYDTTLVSSTCMYDMLSIVYYSRTLNYASMNKGDKVTVSFLSGRRKVDMDIIYQGNEQVSANDGRKYNCIKLALSMNERVFEDKEETMKVYITNDYNRIPIRIDSKLKVGSTRAILKSYKGQKY